MNYLIPTQLSSENYLEEQPRPQYTNIDEDTIVGRGEECQVEVHQHVVEAVDNCIGREKGSSIKSSD